MYSGSGPSSVVITNPHSAVTTVSKLTTGEYSFQLNVRDKAGLESNAFTTVMVKDGQYNFNYLYPNVKFDINLSWPSFVAACF